MLSRGKKTQLKIPVSVKNERPKNSEIRVLQESIKNLSATVQTIQTAIAKPEAVPETLSGCSLTKKIDRENDRTKPNTTVQKGKNVDREVCRFFH